MMNSYYKECDIYRTDCVRSMIDPDMITLTKLETKSQDDHDLSIFMHISTNREMCLPGAIVNVTKGQYINL